MKRLTTAALVAFLVILVLPPAATGKSKEAAIRELLEIVGTEALARQMIVQAWPDTWDLVRRAFPEISDDLSSVLEAEFLIAVDETMPVFIEGGVEIYSKYFTEEEIFELLAWYKTDLGQRSIAVMPQLVRESVDWGQRWGEKIVAPRAMERVADRLREEGYQL